MHTPLTLLASLVSKSCPHIILTNGGDHHELLRLSRVFGPLITTAQDLPHAYSLLSWGKHVLIDESDIPSGKWRASLIHTSRHIHIGSICDILDLSEGLAEHGWSYDESLTEPKSYTRRGDTLLLSLLGTEEDPHTLLEISWFDDTIESISLKSELNSKSYTKWIFFWSDIRSDSEHRVTIESLTELDILTVEHGYGMISYLRDFSPLGLTPLEHLRTDDIHHLSSERVHLVELLKCESIVRLRDILSHEKNLIILTKSPEKIRKRLKTLELTIPADIQELPPRTQVISHTARGKVRDEYQQYFKVSGVVDRGQIFVLSDDILTPLLLTIKKRSDEQEVDIGLLLKISIGDHIVHRDHGIGIYEGLEIKRLGTSEKEYIRLKYRDESMLYVPATEAYRLSKYLGEDDPKLHSLGTSEWQKTLQETNKDAEKIARELLSLYSERQTVTGFAFASFPQEEALFREAFVYSYTYDQRKAIDEILSNMSESSPMDHLLSGDVGFGKTEVAMNAIYRAVLNHKQVALISPLVVLASEHYETLTRRLGDFGVRVALITRMTSDKDLKKMKIGIQDGSIQVVIGTHRILTSEIIYRDLGLLVIDEEHRFGVMEKEAINAIRSNIDILSLSATPIPRSLNMALSGVKKISLLTTPPRERQAIETHIMRYDPKAIREVIEREIKRGGQVIILHNRVESLSRLALEIQEITHEISNHHGKPLMITQIHGGMTKEELEDHILRFRDHRADILISTTVIENGVNFTNANTIIIHEAHHFGLSSLHQLRGRVGRKDRQAYALLTYRDESLSSDAKKRLITLQEHSYLGAGFELALKDLEIRGAGEVLGIKQSGHTRDTGIPLFLQILEDKLHEIKTGSMRRKNDVKIELDIATSTDDSLFLNEEDKIHFYRHSESLRSLDALEAYEEEMCMESGSEGMQRFFLMLKAKIILAHYGVEKVSRVGQNYFLEFGRDHTLEELQKLLAKDQKGYIIFLSLTRVRIEARLVGSSEDFLRWVLATLPPLT